MLAAYRRMTHTYILLSALLASCGSPLPRQAEILRTGTSCCASIAELPASGTLASESAIFEITDQTKIFDFPQGRSHFVAVGLKTGPGRRLEVRTWNRGTSKLDAQIFCPVLTLLDGSKKVVGTVELTKMEFTRAGLIESSRYTQVVNLPDATEYVVVHTWEDLRGRNLSAPFHEPGTVIVLGSSAYYSPGSNIAQNRCGQQGRITLTLQ